MRLLLDTHILIPLLDTELGELPPAVHERLSEKNCRSFASVASLWEIAIKSRIGKLRLAPSLADLPALLGAASCGLLEITAQHTLAEVAPWPLTRDPFDRLLLAVCEVEGLKLVTLDEKLRTHPLALPPSA